MATAGLRTFHLSMGFALLSALCAAAAGCGGGRVPAHSAGEPRTTMRPAPPAPPARDPRPPFDAAAVRRGMSRLAATAHTTRLHEFKLSFYLGSLKLTAVTLHPTRKRAAVLYTAEGEAGVRSQVLNIEVPVAREDDVTFGADEIAEEVLARVIADYPLSLHTPGDDELVSLKVYREAGDPVKILVLISGPSGTCGADYDREGRLEKTFGDCSKPVPSPTPTPSEETRPMPEKRSLA